MQLYVTESEKTCLIYTKYTCVLYSHYVPVSPFLGKL